MIRLISSHVRRGVNPAPQTLAVGSVNRRGFGRRFVARVCDTCGYTDTEPRADHRGPLEETAKLILKLPGRKGSY